MGAIATLFGAVALLTCWTVSGDSAGIVEMVNGLAYGGIPYGSVTGMLARDPRNIHQRQSSYATSRVVVSPNFRAAGVAARQQGPVQIYNLPGVVAPGIVGRFSQIGY